MYAITGLSVITPKRPPSPQGFFICGQESRESTHFSNTIQALNAQLRDMDVSHRMVSRDAFIRTINETVTRLVSHVSDKKLAALFVKLSGETKLPSKATIAELASGKFGVGKSQADAYDRFKAGLGMAGRVAFAILAEKEGHTAVFNAEFTAEGIGSVPARNLDSLRGSYGDSRPPIYEAIPDETQNAQAYSAEIKPSAPYANPNDPERKEAAPRLRTGSNPSLKNTYDDDTEQSKRDTDERIAQTREDMGYHSTVIISKARNIRQQEANAARIALEQNIAAELLAQDGRKLAELEKQAARAEQQKSDSTAKLSGAFKISEYKSDGEG
jgi:hypothetical protein